MRYALVLLGILLLSAQSFCADYVQVSHIYLVNVEVNQMRSAFVRQNEVLRETMGIVDSYIVQNVVIANHIDYAKIRTRVILKGVPK